MGDVWGLVINLATAFVFFVCGLLTRSLNQIIRSRRARAFWGSRMLHSRILLFVGEISRFNHLEPTGLVGVGDLHALHAMTTGLAALGSSFEVARLSQVFAGQHRENLILLGGGEANSLTTMMLERVGSGYRLDSNAMTIADRLLPDAYRTEWDAEALDGSASHGLDHSWFVSTDAAGGLVARRFRTDYGIIIRTRNPFAPDKTLVLICGIYGFGTWAGARLPFDPEFLSRIRGMDNFECLYRVQVHERQPLKTDVLVLRALPGIPAPSPEDSGRRIWGRRSDAPPPYEFLDGPEPRR